MNRRRAAAGSLRVLFFIKDQPSRDSHIRALLGTLRFDHPTMGRNARPLALRTRQANY